MLRLRNEKMKLTLILLLNRFLGPCPVLERGKLFSTPFSCGRPLDCTGCSHIWLFSKEELLSGHPAIVTYFEECTVSCSRYPVLGFCLFCGHSNL